jgi:amidase
LVSTHALNIMVFDLKKLAPSTGNAEYQKKVAALKADREAQIPKELRLPKELVESPPLDVTGIPASSGLLTKDELAITELDATEIRDRVAAGKLTSVDVVTAFGKRAAIAHQLVSCLTDWFLPEALVRAKWLDDYFAKNGKVVGPLHGVPISVKVRHRSILCPKSLIC